MLKIALTSMIEILEKHLVRRYVFSKVKDYGPETLLKMNLFSIQMQNHDTFSKERPKSKKYHQNMHGKTIFNQFYMKNTVISHSLLNLHGRTYCLFEKK